jgi:hypothetical protein
MWVANVPAPPRHFLRDLGLCRRLLAISLFLGGIARLVDELGRALFRLGDDLGRAAARLAHRILGLPGGLLERAAPLVRCGEAVRNRLLPRLDGADQVGPDDLRGEPDEQREDDRLREERRIHVHGALPILLLAERRGERIGEGEEHRDAQADDERRVDQAEQ